MQFLTDDAQFGIRLTPADESSERGFFTLQLIVGGVPLGDQEKSIVFTAIRALNNLDAIDDPRFVPHPFDPAAVMAILQSEPKLNDLSIRVQCESLDQCAIRAFRVRGCAVFIGRRTPRSRWLHALVPITEYQQVVGAATQFWADCAGQESKTDDQI